MGDLVIFNAYKLDTDGEPYTSGSSLWAYDKTDSSVERITNTLVQYHDDPRDLNVIGSTLYFTAESTAGGSSLVRELWKTDGTFSGTSLVSIIADGGNSFTQSDYPQEMFELDGSLLTWAFVGSENGRELIHNQSTLTTISYSY